MLKLSTAIAALVIVSTNANAAPTYADVLRTCAAEWQERTDKATRRGVDAWNAFRVECVARKGYVTKAARRATFERVPDAVTKQ